MEHNFVLISVDVNHSIDSDAMRKTLDNAVDWIQFASNQWLLWTNSSTAMWFSRIQPLIGDDDKVIIWEVSKVHKSGNMPKSFWDFVRKYTDQSNSEQ